MHFNIISANERISRATPQKGEVGIMQYDYNVAGSARRLAPALDSLSGSGVGANPTLPTNFMPR